MRNARSLNRRAFTFVDLAITILVIGILTAVAVPKFADTMQRQRLSSAIRQVTADIELARRHARATSGNETLTISIANETYTFSSVKDPNHHSQLKSIDLTEAPFKAQIVSSDFNGSSDLTFNTYGAPTSGGSIVLKCGSYETTITVAADTGATTATTPAIPAPPVNNNAPPVYNNSPPVPVNL